MKVKASIRPRSRQAADNPRTIQQQRAAFCYKRVQKVVALKNNDVSKVFKAKASSLPAMVQMNGLGQSLAFAKSKFGRNIGFTTDSTTDSKKPEGIAWQHLYQLISDWHSRETGCYPGRDVLEGIMSEDMHVYRQAQAETQALMVWVKQFARAEIHVEKRGGNE